MYQVHVPRAKQKRRTENEWQKIFSDQESSGLSQQTYCQQNGIVLSTYYNWRQRLSKKPKKKSGRHLPQPVTELFIEVPGHSHTRTCDTRSRHWDIELDLGEGICLRLSKSR